MWFRRVKSAIKPAKKYYGLTCGYHLAALPNIPNTHIHNDWEKSKTATKQINNRTKERLCERKRQRAPSNIRSIAFIGVVMKSIAFGLAFFFFNFLYIAPLLLFCWSAAAFSFGLMAFNFTLKKAPAPWSFAHMHETYDCSVCSACTGAIAHHCGASCVQHCRVQIHKMGQPIQHFDFNWANYNWLFLLHGIYALFGPPCYYRIDGCYWLFSN